MDGRFVDLRWIVPLVIGTIAFLVCLFAFVEQQRSGWDMLVIVVLSAGFVGAGVFNKIAVTTDGLIIESAQASQKSIRDIEAAAQKNEVVLRKLAERVEEIAKLTHEMTKLPQTPAAIAAQGNALSVESVDLAAALKALGSSVTTVVDSASAVKETVGQLLDYVGWGEKEKDNS
jgi:hypothetical protein